jgi:hypothetical protein
LVQPRTVGFNPRQLALDLARGHSTDDGQTVKLNRALPPITQLNMDVGKQVVTGVHDHARCREFFHDRHRSKVVQQLHHVKPRVFGILSALPGLKRRIGGSLGSRHTAHFVVDQ